ncbi:NAD+ kinase [Entomortierella parvispora]|uniref:NAD+ kinase n=1 Tax=Entomortierella parvispora TaxID=205924 RepID=A0A9P3H4L2_9FUNG|nr:NAD+ kinase [Entomortierella parvispora]
MTPMEDPLTANIIHDTTGSNLVHAMAVVAAAGADAGAAADAASARSSSSSVHHHDTSSSSLSSASSTSSPSSSTESNTGRARMSIDVQDSVDGSTRLNASRARVKWETPKTVMIVTKPGDESLLKITREIALWMIASRGLTVFVDEKLKDIPKFKYPSFLKSTKLGHDYTQSLRFWTSDLCAQEAHLFDFAVTLGGDGTVLFTSWLFQRIVPPILPFSAGSLGFLTPFPTVDYRKTLSTCLDHGVRVNLRMRFSCTIYRCLEHRAVDKTKKKKRKNARRRNKDGTSNVAAFSDDSDDDSDKERRSLPTVLTTPTETFEILNDLVLDRGPSANLSLLELFGDEEHLTTVQADGIVISTPTGSTAYSLAAGGPLTHPEIPAILISPICPHTLSFRPMLLPDSMELRICVPFDSRSTAWASFDGRGRVELKQGDHIKVTASTYPFPTICSSTQSSDWFHSLSRCLRWNERERQKGFRVVEHSRPRRTRQPSSSSLSPPGSKLGMTSGDLPASLSTGGGGAQDLHSHGTATPTEHNVSGFSAQGGNHQHHHSHHHHSNHGHSHNAHGGSTTSLGQEWHPASGNSSTSSSRARQHSLRSGPASPTARRSSQHQHSEYFDHSPQDTDTMLTCWGTDTSDSDDDDEDDSDPVAEKEDAEDGDGEWEENSSSDDDDDDDNQVARRAAHGDLTGQMALSGFPGAKVGTIPSSVGASPNVSSTSQRDAPGA